MPFPDLPIDAWAAILALLAVTSAAAVMRLRRRGQQASALIRRAGGRRVDPDSGPSTPPQSPYYADSSDDTRPMSSFSQMVEVRGQMNPLTEAEVLMALGRSEDAEAILLEAIRWEPTRIGLRVKLAEVNAQRPDPVAFQSAAFKLRLITGARGPLWDNICRMGRHVDPGNPEYRNMQAASGTSAFAMPELQDGDAFAETLFATEPAPLERRRS